MADIADKDFNLGDGVDNEEVRIVIEKVREWNEETLRQENQLQKDTTSKVLPGQEANVLVASS